MKASRLLFGATGFSIAAAGLFMGAGTASAACEPDVVFCGGGSPGIAKAVQKLEGIIANKAPVHADFHIVKVVDKMSASLD